MSSPRTPHTLVRVEDLLEVHPDKSWRTFEFPPTHEAVVTRIFRRAPKREGNLPRPARLRSLGLRGAGVVTRTRDH